MTFFDTTATSKPSWARDMLRAVTTVFSRGLRSVQVAQMTSALRQFSDAQLEEIGVKRSEIAQHAETLV